MLPAYLTWIVFLFFKTCPLILPTGKNCQKNFKQPLRQFFQQYFNGVTNMLVLLIDALSSIQEVVLQAGEQVLGKVRLECFAHTVGSVHDSGGVHRCHLLKAL